MQRAFTSFAALLLVLAATTPSAWAKNSTVKITISGGALTGAIELNDQQILAISNIWSGEFLDRSKGTAKEPPRGLARYEVSFYVKATQSDARERYVSYYCPNSATEPGYVYLPGEGETWHSLNVEAIVRMGQDGRWNYASPAWEDLIKPAIAHAEAPVKH